MFCFFVVIFHHFLVILYQLVHLYGHFASHFGSCLIVFVATLHLFVVDLFLCSCLSFSLVVLFLFLVIQVSLWTVCVSFFCCSSLFTSAPVWDTCRHEHTHSSWMLTQFSHIAWWWCVCLQVCSNGKCAVSLNFVLMKLIHRNLACYSMLLLNQSDIWLVFFFLLFFLSTDTYGSSKMLLVRNPFTFSQWIPRMSQSRLIYSRSTRSH